MNQMMFDIFMEGVRDASKGLPKFFASANSVISRLYLSGYQAVAQE